MRIGGIQISRSKPEVVVDATAPIRKPTPKKVVYGRVSKNRRSLTWNDPEFDFKEIAKCLATEAFFRRTIDKYIELVWRNEYTLKGNNPRTVEYIRERLRQIAIATDTNTEIFLRSLTQQIVTYSNCFIEKARDVKASGGRIRRTIDGRTLDPVAGYYLVDATSVKIAKDEHGRILQYKQDIRERSGDAPEWSPDNLIHIAKDREVGLSFGTPMVQPVLDDIKALRRMEENIEMLVFSHAMPLYTYLVGDDQNSPTDQEIQDAKYFVNEMPTEGMLIIPYYHTVTAVGAEGRALRCEGYLDYFRNRIFAGLGTSEVAMGYSGSASRSAADTIEKAMYNTVREFQNIIKIYLEEEIIKELLAEGNYEWNDDNRVQFHFPEIDIDDKIKYENHIVNLYSGNIITESEARNEIGREPIQDEERSELYFNTVELVRALVQAVDEPFTTTAGPAGLTKMLRTALPGGVRAAKSLDMPSNQHGTKLAPGTTKDSVVDSVTPVAQDLLSRLHYPYYNSTLMKYYSMAMTDAVSMVRMKYIKGYESDGMPVIETLRDYEKGNLDMIVNLSKAEMLEKSGEFILHAYQQGVQEACNQASIPGITFNVSPDIDYLHRKNNEWLTRCMDVIGSSSEAVMRKVTDKSEAVSSMISVFDSTEYRVRLGCRNELQRAYNIGIFRGGMEMGYTKFSIGNIANDEDGRCQVHSGVEYNIDAGVDLDSVPPGYMTHHLCTCTIKLMS